MLERSKFLFYLAFIIGLPADFLVYGPPSVLVVKRL